MYTVLAIFEAKTGKEVELETELKEALERCKAEKINMESRLHKSIDNPTQFFLYENWESEEKYSEFVKSPTVKVITDKVKSLLAKSPHVSFGKEL